MRLNPRITQLVSYLCFLVPYGLLGMFFVFLVWDDSYWPGLGLLDSLYMVLDTVSKGVLVLAPATVVRGLLFAKWGIWRPFWALLVGGATSGFGFLIANLCENHFIGWFAAVMLATVFPGWQAPPRDPPVPQSPTREAQHEEKLGERISVHMPNPWSGDP